MDKRKKIIEWVNEHGINIICGGALIIFFTVAIVGSDTGGKHQSDNSSYTSTASPDANVDGGNYGLVNNDPTTSYGSSKSKKSNDYTDSDDSYSSKGYTDSNGTTWHDSPDGNGVMTDDGHFIYENPDGSTEITDGYGNWAQDTDGDGVLDKYGSDNY